MAVWANLDEEKADEILHGVCPVQSAESSTPVMCQNPADTKKHSVSSKPAPICQEVCVSSTAAIFHPRCRHAEDICKTETPTYRSCGFRLYM